jgi:hypothetical protein
MKNVNLNLTINTILSGQQPGEHRSIPRVNAFKEPYTLPEGQQVLKDDNGIDCVDLTTPGTYTHTFNLNAHERCGIDIISFLGNSVTIDTDLPIHESAEGTVIKRQLSITETGTYNITIDIT